MTDRKRSQRRRPVPGACFSKAGEDIKECIKEIPHAEVRRKRSNSATRQREPRRRSGHPGERLRGRERGPGPPGPPGAGASGQRRGLLRRPENERGRGVEGQRPCADPARVGRGARTGQRHPGHDGHRRPFRPRRPAAFQADGHRGRHDPRGPDGQPHRVQPEDPPGAAAPRADRGRRQHGAHHARQRDHLLPQRLLPRSGRLHAALLSPGARGHQGRHRLLPPGRRDRAERLHRQPADLRGVRRVPAGRKLPRPAGGAGHGFSGHRRGGAGQHLRAAHRAPGQPHAERAARFPRERRGARTPVS